MFNCCHVHIQTHVEDALKFGQIWISIWFSYMVLSTHIFRYYFLIVAATDVFVVVVIVIVVAVDTDEFPLHTHRRDKWIQSFLLIMIFFHLHSRSRDQLSLMCLHCTHQIFDFLLAFEWMHGCIETLNHCLTTYAATDRLK